MAKEQTIWIAVLCSHGKFPAAKDERNVARKLIVETEVYVCIYIYLNSFNHADSCVGQVMIQESYTACFLLNYYR